METLKTLRITMHVHHTATGFASEYHANDMQEL
jgi:hypothetical protein